MLIFFSYSGPSGILGSDGKQNTAKPVLGGVRIVVRSHEQTHFFSQAGARGVRIVVRSHVQTQELLYGLMNRLNKIESVHKTVQQFS